MVEKELRVRVHDCPHCGYIADRDVNAAINILALRSHYRHQARTEASRRGEGTIPVDRRSPGIHPWGVVTNHKDIRDQNQLDVFEAILTKKRMADLFFNPTKGKRGAVCSSSFSVHDDAFHQATAATP